MSEHLHMSIFCTTFAPEIPHTHREMKNQMFKITPPGGQNVVNNNPLPPHTGRRVLRVLAALSVASLVVFLGYRRGLPPQPVVLDRNLFHNADSINLYARIAAREDDPKALFVTGMASHLRFADPEFPQDAHTVPPEEGEHMLILAAELGSEDAMTYIRCLHAHGCWNHYLPASCR